MNSELPDDQETCVTDFHTIPETRHNIWLKALTNFLIKWTQWVPDIQTSLKWETCSEDVDFLNKGKLSLAVLMKN